MRTQGQSLVEYGKSTGRVERSDGLPFCKRLHAGLRCVRPSLPKTDWSCMRTACVVTVGLVLLLPVLGQADDEGSADATASSSSTWQQVETRVLDCLNDGDQKEAEKSLTEEASRYFDVGQFEKLKPSPGSDAETVVHALAEHHRDKQRLFFWLAACHHSRAETKLAFPFFCLVLECDPETKEGKCARCILHLNSFFSHETGRDPDEAEFAELMRLADANPEDLILRWMAAIQCRNWNRNQEAVRHYKTLLEKWRSGPVMVHHAYAGLLDDLQQYDDAVVERKRTVAMEPAGWSYDGLGNTLRNLKRYQEATEAHIRAVRFEPKKSVYWSNWASTLFSEGNYAEAIAMAKHAIQLDRHNKSAWQIWERSLTWQGHFLDAKEKSHEANAVLYGKK